MKQIIITVLCLTGLSLSQNLKAQTVSINAANVITLANTNVVYVAGTLTGVKGIPITGYTVDVISSDQQTTRVVTNQPSSGGNFSYTGAVSVKGNAPYTVKVTTNRQANNTFNAKSCNCQN